MDIGEALTGAVSSCLAAEGEGPAPMVTGWCLVVETIDDDGETWLHKYAMPGQKSWRGLGMMRAYTADLEADFVWQDREIGD